MTLVRARAQNLVLVVVLVTKVIVNKVSYPKDGKRYSGYQRLTVCQLVPKVRKRISIRKLSIPSRHLYQVMELDRLSRDLYCESRDETSR